MSMFCSSEYSAKEANGINGGKYTVKIVQINLMLKPLLYTPSFKVGLGFCRPQAPGKTAICEWLKRGRIIVDLEWIGIDLKP
jgi:hypothetical protein